MKTKYLKTILIILVVILNSQIVHSLSVQTHEAINEEVAKKTLNGFSLDSYLKNNLGISGGVNQLFYNKEVYKWLRDGGKFEDEPTWTFPYIRSLNHFHNPLKSVDQAGFSGIWLPIPGITSGKSTILWSQSALGTQSPGGHYSWHDARDAFYKALTSSDQTTRNTNFANTFRGLGQLMHLVQDMSVPEHTRNQSHGFGGYEGWVKGKPSALNNALADPVFFKSDGLGKLSSAFAAAPVPIANLFDTHQYGGSNPEVTRQYYTIVTTPTGTIKLDMIGLSEYTNANFLTSDTLFKSYTHPSLANTNYSNFANLPITIVTTPGNVNHNTFYISGYGKQNLAGLKYVAEEIYGSGQQELQKLQFTLDNRCYDEYAQDLLPRAVGYSAGLLNYFFRGQLSLVPAGDTMDQYVLVNSSTEEVSGTFSLYYDDEANNRIFIKKWENITIAPATQQGQQTIPGQSALVTFPTPTTPAPKEKNMYFLVFQGKMGNEEGAVAGKVVRWWHEEWDKELKDNHPWLYTLTDFWWSGFDWNNGNSAVIDGRLVEENIRPSGNQASMINGALTQRSYKTESSTPWYCIDKEHTTCLDYDFGKEFPYPITRNTWVRVKIDEMSINVDIPYQYCNEYTRGPGGTQELGIGFGNGQTFSFTVPGQEPAGDGTILAAYIQPGVEKAFNIFEAFKNAGIEVQEPLNVTSIYTQQIFWYHCYPTTEEHRLRMVVDYIRLEER